MADEHIQHGRAFCFGVGNTRWTDVAALGLYGFDWDREARHFSLVAAPVAALSIEALPATLQNGAARVTFTHLRFADKEGRRQPCTAGTDLARIGHHAVAAPLVGAADLSA